jgi:formylglycine-generating enzyme required for sulfatase activity
MVPIPSGTLNAGSPTEQSQRAKGETRVSVRIAAPFAVGKYAVTVGEFITFLNSTTDFKMDACTAKQPDGEWATNTGATFLNPGFPVTNRHPAVCVNWHAAQSYVDWLSKKTGKSYRLLSEHEREYVALARSSTDNDDRPFWWGTTITTELANFDNSRRSPPYTQSIGIYRMQTLPVDSFEPNNWGLHNVHGNVWEWTADCWNDANPSESTDGEARLAGNCEYRVTRGGGWNSEPHNLRAAQRDKAEASKSYSVVGFRVARAR